MGCRQGDFTLGAYRKSVAGKGLDIETAAAREVGEALSGGLVAVVVVAKCEGEVAGEVFLTSISKSVAERHAVHAAVCRVAGAVDGHGNDLKVVSGIDEYLACVGVVLGTLVYNVRRHIDDDNNVLSIDNT